VLSKLGNRKRAIALTRKQFRYGFGNALNESESGELFDKWAPPGPGKPLFVASITDGAKSPTSPCPGSPARTCDTQLSLAGVPVELGPKLWR
jgi:hypothetical protein